MKSHTYSGDLKAIEFFSFNKPDDEFKIVPPGGGGKKITEKYNIHIK